MRNAAPAQEALPVGPATPPEVFARIRNYLAGSHIGATRDSTLLEQVLLCLFAKLRLAQAGHGSGTQNGKNVRRDYGLALRDLRGVLPSDALPHGSLVLDTAALEYVDRWLSLLDLTGSGSDLVGDAYQCFLGSEIRGQDGQFFTPLSAIKILLACIDPQPGERVIDPAAGAGGFLFAAAQSLLGKGLRPAEIARSLYGVEKDKYLARLARMRLSLLTLHPTNLVVGDSLAWSSAEPSFMSRLKPGFFDVVLTNPPFGAKIVAASDSLRSHFTLAYRWVAQQPTDSLVRTHELMRSTPPQVLFLEQCLSLVKPAGRIGVVLPESILSGKNYRHVVQFIRESAVVEAVIGMPDALFKTSGKGGTHTKTALLCLTKLPTGAAQKKFSVFMAEATWCGHDSRARRIPRDDGPAIIANWRLWRTEPRSFPSSLLGYIINSADLKAGILAPRAYDPQLPELIRSLEDSHFLLGFRDLAQKGILSVTTGDEVGKLVYGTGDIPFVRTSDLSNWEIKTDPKHGVSRAVYDALKTKQDVQAGDILMVRDGTYLIGTCAIVTKYDTEIVLQSHIYKIRVNSNELFDPFLLLAILSSPSVQRQIRAQSQTQDIINSLGNRINDLILPVPRDESARQDFSQRVQRVIQDRIEAREIAREIIETIAPKPPSSAKRSNLIHRP